MTTHQVAIVLADLASVERRIERGARRRPVAQTGSVGGALYAREQPIRLGRFLPQRRRCIGKRRNLGERRGSLLRQFRAQLHRPGLLFKPIAQRRNLAARQLTHIRYAIDRRLLFARHPLPANTGNDRQDGKHHG